MRYIFIILLFSINANALDLSQEDKEKHVAASAVLNTAIYSTIRLTSKTSKSRAFLASSFITLAIGMAKELTDVQVDHEDMEANALGVSLTLPIITF